MDLPHRDLLTDPEPMLRAAVGAAGGDLVTARPRQVSWNPGGSTTVRYDARVRWAGTETDELLVASTAAAPDPVLRLESPGREVSIWRVPHDPWLPGLAAATDEASLHDLLDGLGADGGALRHRLAAYRPGRRAVVHVRRGSTSVFLKVVRPSKARALHERHLALRPHVPVPASLGVDETRGILVLQALGGTLLRRQLTTALHPLPPARIVAMLDRLPEPSGAPGEASSWRSGPFAAQLAAVVPHLRDRLDALAARLTEAERALDEPIVPVHGDLHEAQVLVDGGTITGLLDIDTFGWGRRVDDIATLVGHLATLALESRQRTRIERYAAAVLADADRRHDPVVLRTAVSAVLLGLATGPFRVLQERWEARTEQRVALAEQWLASADRIAERSLTTASRSPHLAGAR